MSVRPDLGQRTRPTDERVIRGHAAVALDPHHLAEVRIERLRAGPLGVAFAQRHEQPSITREYQARSEVVAAGHRRLLPKDHLDVGETPVLETAARDGGAVATVARFRVGQVHEPIGGKIRVEGHVEQATLPDGIDCRHTAERRTHRTVQRDDPQPARTFGHQCAPIRQEGHAPGVFEPARDRHQSNGPVLRLLGGFPGTGRAETCEPHDDEQSRDGQGNDRAHGPTP